MLRREFQHLAEIERRRIVMPSYLRLRLSRLEKPEPWPEELRREVDAAVSAIDVQQYPAYQSFYEQLAAFVGVPIDNIVVGAGIEEFIRTLYAIAPAPGEKVAILWPTCAMFELYARVFGVNLVRIVTDPTYRITSDQLIEQLPEGLRLLIAPNPGQPVETCFSGSAVHRIANRCRELGAVLAVDEAYYGFGAPTAVHMAADFDNMVVLRTFSKAFGAAGIRLGYAVAGKRLARSLNAVRQSGEVSSMSMAVASVLMRNAERFVVPSIAAICDARDTLRARVLAEMKLNAWGRYANHVLIEFPSIERVTAVAAALALRGVLVKANFPAPIDRHMLVTCGSPSLMDLFYEELQAVYDCE
jgi:histidinol-phosphate aminotransferase